MKTKTLVAVQSCHRDRERHNEIRQTWKTHVDFADIRFFLGTPNTESTDSLQKDEIMFEVKDDLPSLTYKTQMMIQYALKSSYDNFFKTDADTFVVGERLKKFSESNKYDYVGLKIVDAEFGHLYAWGGAGYWLSKKSMQVIADIDPDEFFHMAKEAEDVAVGRALYKAGILLHNDTRFSGNMFPGIGKVPSYANDVITTHHVLPGQMQAVYQYFYKKMEGSIKISRGTLIDPKKTYVVRDKKVYEIDEHGIPII